MRKLYVFYPAAFILLFFIAGTNSIGTEISVIYDELNRLVRFEDPEKYVVEYSYDDVGNRTQKMIAASLSDKDYDHDNDVDGIDLHLFLNNWDGNGQSLSDFANHFGQIK